MPKKKKVQTQEGPAEAPLNDTVFPTGAGAAQGAAAANQMPEVQGAANQIPEDVAELIRSTLRVLIAQRRLYGLSTTLTSIVKAVAKALGPYVDGINKAVIRDFIRSEVSKMGYPVIMARVDYGGVKFEAETVVLYRNFEEIVDIIRTGRAESLKPIIIHDGIDPIFDKMAKDKAHE